MASPPKGFPQPCGNCVSILLGTFAGSLSIACLRTFWRLASSVSTELRAILSPYKKGALMKKTVWLAVLAAASLGIVSGTVQAVGCVKGAVVGAAAGHVAGHHAVAGAIAGCVVGRHMAKEQAKEKKNAK